MIRSILVLALVVWISTGAALAAAYKLTDGRTVTGDIVETGSDDATALINAGEGRYERVPWGQFSQDDLKIFVEKYKANKKIYEAVEPFIEVTAEDRAARTEVKIEPAPEIVQRMQNERLEARGSTIASLFKSSVGWFLVVLIIAANVYAGVEIAIFRARPKVLVAALAAIPGLGFLSNIIFLSMPTYIEGQSEEDLAAAQAERLAPTPTIEIPGAAEAAAQQHAAVAQAEAQGARPEVFSRGKFTFNKRFFETKFSGFFGMVRNDENKAKVLIVKSTKGEFVVERITRITPGDLYIQATGVIGETVLHFGEITEVILKPHA
jgi:hypothetical protein